MGQGQSQTSGGRTLGEVRPATPEPDMDPEERARMQAEERERRAAAAQQRFASQQKKGAANGTPGAAAMAAQRKKTALEEMSAENRGWRAADEQATLRAYN